MSAALQFEQYRPALTGHCYRMLGSVVDAEDAVHEAMFRAWKGIGRFEARASLQTWLTHVATNVCLDALAAGARRRVRPIECSDAPGVVRDDVVLTQHPRAHWVEPIPDAMALPAASGCDPEARAVLLLTQVLDWSAAETAACLGMSVAAVNSAAQRARATLAAHNPPWRRGRSRPSRRGSSRATSRRSSGTTWTRSPRSCTGRVRHAADAGAVRPLQRAPRPRPPRGDRGGVA
ncbi:hypothetical protein tb265_43380 [Gemmatimonadetes bacterium T265]|nr:hypothetical protein tb265_43380 [Gemmatimonadetes bacterium T265]